jgi:hypothetical protein
LRLTATSGELGRVRFDSRAVTFTDEESTFTIVCEMTLTTSLHGSTAKTAGTLAGLVNDFRVANCRGGTWTVLTGTLPWHITYQSFTGTLPTITSVRWRIERFSWLMSAFFGLGRCLYSGELEVITSGNPVTGATINERRAIGLAVNLGGFECPPGFVFRGTFVLSPTVRLALA